MNTLTNQLRNYVDAAFSGLWIETYEPDEAVKEIDALCRSENWKYAVWDIERGLCQDGEFKTTDPLPVVQSLTSLADSTTPTLLILRNYHRFLGSIDIIQAIERQIAQGKTRRAFVVVLAPVVQIPAELEKLFVVVEHPLPDKEQLRQIAQEVLGGTELPDESNTHRLGRRRWNDEIRSRGSVCVVDLTARRPVARAHLATQGEYVASIVGVAALSRRDSDPRRPR